MLHRLIFIALLVIAALLVVIAVLIATGFANIESTMSNALCELQYSSDTMSQALCKAG